MFRVANFRERPQEDLAQQAPQAHRERQVRRAIQEQDHLATPDLQAHKVRQVQLGLLGLAEQVRPVPLVRLARLVQLARPERLVQLERLVLLESRAQLGLMEPAPQNSWFGQSSCSWVADNQ